MEQEAKLGEVKQGCKLLLHSQTLTIRSQKSWIKYVFFRLPSIVSNWILEVKSTFSIQDLHIQFQIKKQKKKTREIHNAYFCE